MIGQAPFGGEAGIGPLCMCGSCVDVLLLKGTNMEAGGLAFFFSNSVQFILERIAN